MVLTLNNSEIDFGSLILSKYFASQKNWEFSHEMETKDFRIHCCKKHFTAFVSFWSEKVNIASWCMDCDNFCTVRKIMKSIIKLCFLIALLIGSISGQNANHFRQSSISILRTISTSKYIQKSWPPPDPLRGGSTASTQL